MDYFEVYVMVLGHLIQRKRKEQGISGKKFADKYGRSQPWLSHIEHGDRSLSLPLFLRIEKDLGYEVSGELLIEADNWMIMVEEKALSIIRSKNVWKAIHDLGGKPLLLKVVEKTFEDHDE